KRWRALPPDYRNPCQDKLPFGLLGSGIMITRRSAFEALAATALGAPVQPAAPLKGRLKQSVSRWCYGNMSLDDLCRPAARMGIKGVDLIESQDWPTVQKYGLVPSMVPGAGTIPTVSTAQRTTTGSSASSARTLKRRRKPGCRT